MNETRDAETMNIIKYIFEKEAPVTLDEAMLELLQDEIIRFVDGLTACMDSHTSLELKHERLKSELAKYKPSWDDAPEWAQWLAQTEDFAWGWYEKKPYLWDRVNGWAWNDEDIDSQFDEAQAPNWQDTLEQRP